MMKSDNANQLLNWTFMRKATAQDVVRRIQYGDDPNGCDWEKSTPLHKAIQAYNFDAFRTLMEHGADPLVRDSSGYSLRDQLREAFGNTDYPPQQESLRKIEAYLSSQSQEEMMAAHERAQREKAERAAREDDDDDDDMESFRAILEALSRCR